MISLQNIHQLPEGFTAFGSSLEIDFANLVEKSGMKVNGAYLCSYMLRRFGPPNFPSDAHKSLCTWLLKTEFPDCWLVVTPYLGDEGVDGERVLSFAGGFTRDLRDRTCGRTPENLAAYEEWTRRAAEWYIVHARLIPVEEANSVKCLSSKLYERGEAYPLSIETEEPRQAYSVYLEEENPDHKPTSSEFIFSDVGTVEELVRYMMGTGEFQRAYADRVNDTFSGWVPCAESVARINKAILGALKDLQRPVCVRDVYFTPAGLDRDEELEEADCYEHAGCRMKSAYVPDPDSTWSI